MLLLSTVRLSCAATENCKTRVKENAKGCTYKRRKEGGGKEERQRLEHQRQNMAEQRNENIKPKTESGKSFAHSLAHDLLHARTYALAHMTRRDTILASQVLGDDL